MAIQESALQQVVNHIQAHIRDVKQRRLQLDDRRPFVLGISGLQGSGKSTWAGAIAQALRRNDLKVLVVSLDDFYHTHEKLVDLRGGHASNKLLRTRGQPGTHDEQLAQKFFEAIANASWEVHVPAFDKSRFDGEGDRVPMHEWEVVSNDPPIDVVIFEGWCVGFSAMSEAAIEKKWLASKNSDELWTKASTNTLRDHSFKDVLAINANLKCYNETFMRPMSLSYLILLDTDHLANVYNWRLDQEHALRAKTGSGMSDDQVIDFVRGYMPAYELYLEKLQRESFVPRRVEDVWRSTQLRVTLDRNRAVMGVEEMY